MPVEVFSSFPSSGISPGSAASPHGALVRGPPLFPSGTMADPTFIANRLPKANSRTARTRQQLTDTTPLYANAEYSEWRDIWRSIRHAMIGEPAIKRESTRYLPQLEGMDTGQYAAYLDRAVFFNMTYRTVTGLTGSIFRRAPRVLKAGPKITKLMKRLSKDGLSLELLAKVTAQEQLSVGRVGLLLDKAAQAPGYDLVTPYLALYTTENILDWTECEIDGRTEMDMILLREFYVDRRVMTFSGSGKSAKPIANPSYGQLFSRLRRLLLEYNEDRQKWEYKQELFEKDHLDADMTTQPIVTVPMIYGLPFERIPFRFFNATTPLPAVEKPPVLDILTLNISHYKSYAQLEQGRFYTSNPVYFVKGGEESDEYHIGPSLVWSLAANGEAGIIEYNGHGLNSLEKALATKETQAAALGGRLIGDSASAGQSDNQIKLKDRNEQSLLLNVTTVLNENFTALLKLAGEWMNEKNDDLEFRVNQDFLLNNFAAREFRAITLMWQEGLLPIEVIYEFFLQHEVIPEYITQAQFVLLLEDAKQFPNNPDVLAKQEGFPDASGKQAQEQFDEQLTFDEDQANADRTAATAARKSAEKIAAKQPKIPVLPDQAKQALVKDQPQPAPTKPKPTPKA